MLNNDQKKFIYNKAREGIKGGQTDREIVVKIMKFGYKQEEVKAIVNELRGR